MKVSNCIGLCVLLAGNAVSSLELPKEFPSEEEMLRQTERRREDFKDPVKLKAFLLQDPEGLVGMWPDNIPVFKLKYQVQDEVIRPLLWDIYRESLQKVGWKTVSADSRVQKAGLETVLTKDGGSQKVWLETVPSRSNLDDIGHSLRLASSISWMGYFADEPIKKLLREIATDRAKAEDYRMPATCAYLRCANAQETKDFLVVLFADKTRFLTSHRSAIEGEIQKVRKDAGKQKREAIDSALNEIKDRKEKKEKDVK